MKKIEFGVVALDFDGTCVIHRYPLLGEPIDHCIPVLKRMIDAGANICLDTMRKGRALDDAVKYLQRNGVELFGINENPDHPEYLSRTKVYRSMYIGDDALGCPMTYDYKHPEHGQFVDWHRIEDILFPIENTKVKLM